MALPESAESANRRPGQPVKAPPAEIRRDVILMGASAGGIQAIAQVLSELPADFAGAMAVTLHRSAAAHSSLTSILNSRCKLDVIEPRGSIWFEPGRVYVAPPDHHLVFRHGLVVPNHGPKLNHSRPSVDVMFGSGARSFGERVVGVVLTGNLSDGVQGLRVIKGHGGLSVVQEPAEAHAPAMPANAVTFDHVDVVTRLVAMGKVLEALVGARGVAAALRVPGTRRPGDEPSLPSV